jgi:hypothetical protein
VTTHIPEEGHMFEHMTDEQLDRWMLQQMDEGGVKWDTLDAEEALSKGDLTHIIIKPDGSVSVNRGSIMNPINETTS